MKRGMIRVALLLGFLQACYLARAGAAFPLEYKEFVNAQDPVAWMCGKWLGMAPVSSLRTGRLPEGVSLKSVPYLFVANLGGKDIRMLLERDHSPPRLYPDTDGDGDLSNEKPYLPVVSTAQNLEFGPISFPGRESGNTASVRVWIRAFRFGKVYPAGFWTGEPRLGEDSYRIAIADSDLDGRYDGLFSPTSHNINSQAFDYFAIDLNHDGEFQPVESGELFPLSKTIQVKGACYSVEIAPDGSKIGLEKAEPEFGSLDLGGSDAALLLWSDSGAHRLSGSGGRWQAPAGAYRLISLELNRKDETGATWTLRESQHPKNLDTFEIRAGETLAANIGPPLSARTTVTKRGQTVQIGFMLVGRAGEEYAPGALKDGSRVPAPKFKILDESGKVQASDSFQYG